MANVQESGRYAHQAQVFGRSFDLVHKSTVLVVGAGGIGCELLKSLVLTGFVHIHLVDLDTIDVSNLNRQFLFQKQHVKQSKAKVASEAALLFNPDAKIVAYHNSIYEPQFSMEWFSTFDIVLNALDNLAARRYVNMMCLAANIPLIESGTAGYLGQNKTKCFDCDPKPTPKTFPVCTIRSTPSAPIHCIVWAKSFFFNILFGNEDEDASIDATKTQENAHEINQLEKDDLVMIQLKSSASEEGYGKRLFEKIYNEDIQRLCDMPELWKNKNPPIVLNSKNIKDISLKFVGVERDQKIWSLEENFKIFTQCVQLLNDRLVEERKIDPKAVLVFDKDDDVALDFVTAASNLRSQCYGIELQSRFKIKEIAGNIIPAIATTNAIISGMITLQAIKVLGGNYSKCADTYFVYAPKRVNYFVEEYLAKPNPQCAACHSNYFSMELDTETKTVLNVVEKVKQVLALGEGEITLEEGGRLIYDLDFDDNQDRIMNSLGINDGKKVTITYDDEEDAEKSYFIHLFVKHRKTDDIILNGDSLLVRKPAPRIEAPVVIEKGSKRKAEDQGDNPSKVAHITIEEDDDLIML